MTVHRLRDPFRDAPPLDRVPEFVAWARERRGAASLKARQEAEDGARELLDRAAGAFDRDAARELGRLLSRDARDGELRHDRFAPAFHGAIWERVLDDLTGLNEFVARLWRGSEAEAERAAAALLDDPRTLPGAGRALPSALLYLRWPERYAVWLASTAQGLYALAGAPRIRRSQGFAGYRAFCEAALELARSHELAPAEIDGVLTLAARVRRSRARGERELPAPVLGADAFAFLSELGRHEGEAWMAENKARYRSALAEPFRALLRAVAERHLDDLDPELNTDIQTGQVLGSIRRRYPEAGKEYYDFYWGAFSRQRKQEDAQLYVLLRPDRLEAGVTFGEVADDALARARARAKERAAELWSALAPLAPELVFAPSRDEAKEVQVTGSVGLVECLEGERPRIFKRWRPEAPPVGTPELADAVGRVLAGLYPIAALAWLEEQRTPQTREGPEPEPELDAYDLDEVVRDTRLPVEDLEEWIALLRGPKRQALFYGPPGTGKTRLARAIAHHLAAPGGRVEQVPFHPSLAYEDFVEGLRPGPGEGTVAGVRSGLFVDFCEAARRQPDQIFVAIFDEVQRGDLGAVLGEIAMLLEYRGERVALPYSRRSFGVPKNVVVLATASSADGRFANVDSALGRRFHAIELPPSRDVLARFLPRDEEGELALALFDLVQEKVGDRRLAPGHAYFMQDDVSAEGLYRTWRYALRPYLAELWSGQAERLRELERSVSALLGEGI